MGNLIFSPRLWVLAGVFALAGPAFAFNWNPSARTNLSALGELNQYPENRLHKIVGAKGGGDALAVWKIAYGQVNQAYRQAGQTNWAESTAFTSVTKGDAIFGDVAMNRSNDYIIVGITYRWSDFSGIVQDSQLMADLMIGGVKVSDDFIIDSSGGLPYWDVRAAISANGDALVAWGNLSSHQVLARLYRGGVWGATFVVDTADERSLSVAADDNGQFIVFWNPASSGGQKIYCRRFTGGSWNASELIGTSDSTGQEHSPRVGMFGNGGAVVTWTHNFATYDGVVVRRFDGSTWLNQETIDAGSGMGTATNGIPDITVQPDGKAMVLLQQGPPEGHVYVNRLSGAGGSWGGPVDIGCGNLGAILSVDMDTNGNAVAAFQTATTNWWRAYQEGLGWLGCSSAQGFNGQPNVTTVPPVRVTIDTRQKTFLLTPHEIIGIWVQPYTSGFGTLDVNVAPKDVRINTNAMQTASAIVDLYVVQPFDNVCNLGYTQMRFSNDGTTWSPWETLPSAPTNTTTKTGWDLTNPTYGGNSSGGLKRVYIQFKNATCSSIVTDDEILFTGGSAAGGLDIGLRLFDGTTTNKMAAEWPAVSALRIAKNGTNYGIVLVPTNSPDASKFRIQTASGTKSLMKLP